VRGSDASTRTCWHICCRCRFGGEERSSSLINKNRPHDGELLL
jgi:hypothetical protein